jgi:hypothetical protein
MVIWGVKKRQASFTSACWLTRCGRITSCLVWASFQLSVRLTILRYISVNWQCNSKTHRFWLETLIDRNQLGVLDVNRWIILKGSLDESWVILWIELLTYCRTIWMLCLKQDNETLTPIKTRNNLIRYAAISLSKSFTFFWFISFLFCYWKFIILLPEPGSMHCAFINTLKFWMWC